MNTLYQLCLPLLAALPALAAAVTVDPSQLELPAPVPIAYLSEVATDAPTAPEAAPDMGAAAEKDRLEHSRGGTDEQTSNTRLSGVVSGNSATNVFTGSNTITAGSFANMSGLPVVIQNSGANVLIQNATVIQLQLR